jgi:hypothetical protein
MLTLEEIFKRCGPTQAVELDGRLAINAAPRRAQLASSMASPVQWTWR